MIFYSDSEKHRSERFAKARFIRYKIQTNSLIITCASPKSEGVYFYVTLFCFR